MPLRALLDEKDFLSKNLTDCHKKLDFYCPQCKDKFIPVINTKYRIKHFRHTNGTYHGEPESEEHLNGKQFIFNLLSEKFKPLLEPKIGCHYPDIEIGRIAIEFQCSSISLDEYLDRNMVYENYGFTPFWFLGGKFYKNANSYKKKYRKGTISWDEAVVMSGSSLSGWEEFQNSEEYEKWKESLAYKIQRISKLETIIYKDQRVLYYLSPQDQFFVSNWKNRFVSNYLGWFNLQPINKSEILGEFY